MRGGFGDGVVDLIPVKSIARLEAKGHVQERFETFEAEFARGNCSDELEEIASEGSHGLSPRGVGLRLEGFERRKEAAARDSADL
jgi:hypothetical protein